MQTREVDDNRERNLSIEITFLHYPITGAISIYFIGCAQIVYVEYPSRIETKIGGFNAEPDRAFSQQV